jgi:hypothetical protein
MSRESSEPERLLKARRAYAQSISTLSVMQIRNNPGNCLIARAKKFRRKSFRAAKSAGCATFEAVPRRLSRNPRRISAMK